MSTFALANAGLPPSPNHLIVFIGIATANGNGTDGLDEHIMVATTIAARSLDIPNVTHVVNFNLPSDIDDYVHHIGRTGHVGNTGSSTAFLNHGNRNIIRDLLEPLREANQEIPTWLETIVHENTFGNGGSGGGFRGWGGHGRGRGNSRGDH